MLLLVRLVLLAASVVLAEGRIHGLKKEVSLGRQYPPDDVGMDDKGEHDGYHDRDPNVPDFEDQSYETTVKCNEERDDLAMELEDLLREKEELDVQCEADLRHYKEMIEMADEQIDRLKPMVAERLDESDLPPLYKAQYTAIMCTKLYDGFLMEDKISRREVNDICHGRKSLTECKLQSYGMGQDGDYSTGYYKKPKFHTKLLRLQHRVTASPECFQAKAVQDQVDSTRESSKSKSEYCRTEVAKLKVKLDKKGAAEDVLWNRYNGHVSQRETIKKEAAQQVTKQFCAVVANASRQENKTSDCRDDGKASIKAFHLENCLGAPELVLSRS
jgi:hypothetical protein